MMSACLKTLARVLDENTRDRKLIEQIKADPRYGRERFEAGIMVINGQKYKVVVRCQ